VYPTGARRRPAILVLGGSEGGVPGPLATDPLAIHNHAALALGYFKLRGLPQQLSRIPLEYFERALEWLRRQPQVGPDRIAVLGVSHGSEAALLSGAYFPRLVNAVIALFPSDAAICSFPGCLGPAWTFHGCAVPSPFARAFDRGAGDKPGAADHLGELFFAMRRQRVALWSVRTGKVDSLRAVFEGERSHGESERKSQAVSAGLRRRARDRGKSAGGPRPFGYHWVASLNAEGKRQSELIPDAVERLVVQRIFSETIAGKSQMAIARGLNKEGIPRARGKQ
jgi:pimeloyl-ACP methyl ester carboxylesterase